MVWYYDAEQDLLYWATGNPCGDMNGDRRPGDNQYTNSVMALRPRTGEMARYFQFTPHDTHDWDAREPLLLDGRGVPGTVRKLLVPTDPAGRAVRLPDPCARFDVRAGEPGSGQAGVTRVAVLYN